VTDPNKPTSAEEEESFESDVLERLTWPARRAGWAIEKHVAWPAADLARRLAEPMCWPFERLAWALRHRMVWPLQDGFADRERPLRAAIALSVTAIALTAAGAGALTATSPEGKAPAEPIVATAAPLPRPEPPRPAPLQYLSRASLRAPEVEGPVLHGVAPQFTAAKRDNRAAASPTPTRDPSAGKPTGTTDPTGTTNASSGAKPDAPDPVTVKPALDVSRQFADAFVLYEVGKGDSSVRKTFRKTAAKPLVRALRKRPPRLPKGVKVPRARVLNVVPGPRHGTALSVSVALVRLGAASELRLQLRHDEKAGWLVSDVRG